MRVEEMKMLTICPTRSRPEGAAEVKKTWLQTRAEHNHRLFFIVDDDDPCLADYYELEDPYLGVFVCTQKRAFLSTYINHFAVEALSCSDCELVGFVGDDHRFRTLDWDSRWYKTARNNHPAIIYGNDLFQGENLPTACWLTTDIIRTLGYMCPPILKHMELDTVWRLWADTISRRFYFDNVVIEHVHPAAKKAESDEGYERVARLSVEDRQSLGTYLDKDWPADQKKLLALVGR